MQKSIKAPLIDLPLSLQLTDEGRFFFNTQCKGSPGRAQGGMCLDSFPASTLQRMILAGYISSVEVSRSDFTRKRSEVMDLSKLIMYSVLYRRFNDALWERCSSAAFLRRYNRSHPKSPFVQEHLDRGGAIEASSAEGAEEAAALLSAISREAAREVEEEVTDLDDDERRILLSLSRRYAGNISAPFWLLLHGAHKRGEAASVLSDLKGLIKEYLKKSRICDYLALLLMELGVSAERDLVKRAASELFQGNMQIDAVMHNTAARTRVLEEMDRMGAKVTLVWKIRGRSNSIGTDNRLEIAMYNRETDSDLIKRRFEEMKEIDTRKRSLAQHYERAVLSGNGEEIGLIYLNHIEEACRRENIRFESHVSKIDKRDLVVTRMTFHFH